VAGALDRSTAPVVMIVCQNSILLCPQKDQFELDAGISFWYAIPDVVRHRLWLEA
jgi:hypothetical protein